MARIDNHFNFQNNLGLLKVKKQVTTIGHKLIQYNKNFSQIETLDFSGKTKLHRKWESTLLNRRFKKGEEQELQLIEA